MTVTSTSEPPIETAASFLGQVGDRVRAARARHGMTRKDLARHSGVSERHLAQLESGKGNISIVLLRQVAAALSTSPGDLLDDARDLVPEKRMLSVMLDQLDAAQVREARQLIEERFIRDTRRHDRVALIGLRGAGKSTVGHALAAQTGRPFIELADDIERLGGLELNEIFEFAGQAGFRRLERDALRHRLDSDQTFVMATGGGIVSDPATFQLLLGGCYTIWLKADPDTHMSRVIAQGDQRPMAGNRQAMQDLKRILESRAPLYSQADLTIDTSDRTPQSIVEEIRQHWRRAGS
ncbi:helix-turn-helix transcriptional regulator [Minwuia sp.]|uniref:helix-turn-helix transcriptional regulator n=1 Tax=Minwuia sp. TaxID=2493630 RepID=UPI003A95AEFE